MNSHVVFVSQNNGNYSRYPASDNLIFRGNLTFQNYFRQYHLYHLGICILHGSHDWLWLQFIRFVQILFADWKTFLAVWPAIGEIVWKEICKMTAKIYKMRYYISLYGSWEVKHSWTQWSLSFTGNVMLIMTWLCLPFILWKGRMGIFSFQKKGCKTCSERPSTMTLMLVRLIVNRWK